jgi:hypothetical protein
MDTEEATGWPRWNLEKAPRLFLGLQLRLVDVEVQGSMPSTSKSQVLAKDVGNAAKYTHGWLRSTPILRDHCRLERPTNWAAHYLKEDLRQIWLQADKATARRVLTDWIGRGRIDSDALLGSH